MQNTFALRGLILDTPVCGGLRARNGFLVCENGVVEGVYDVLPDRLAHIPVTDCGDRLILPGMSDLHLHAPQYSYCGTAMDLELLDWLDNYTYPEESRYQDMAHARAYYGAFVRDLLHTATTRAAIFATIHTDATLELMRQLDAAGLGAYVGKLNMDRNCPDHYSEKTPENGERETRRWLEACREAGFARVFPILTPRFTPSVTDAYMEKIGALAREYGVPMQSHLSENRSEIEWVKALCPDAKNYADTYARYGLFGGRCKTIMAHCIYCPEEEDRMMKDGGVFIAHCPTSNENVIAGVAPAARYLRGGYAIGLGSDVAGGHTLDLLTVIASAVQVSKLRWRYVDDSEKPLTMPEALYMATAGGGRFFGKVGLFEKGYAFDAVVIDDSALTGLRAFSPAERIERCAYLGKARVEAKYVDGVKVL
ncbi:MAG: amidohydrolase family protein [Clostridia bacterium]|nr:amidohydrolase family protein [Clostridia bacterium]